MDETPTYRFKHIFYCCVLALVLMMLPMGGYPDSRNLDSTSSRSNRPVSSNYIIEAVHRPILRVTFEFNDTLLLYTHSFSSFLVLVFSFEYTTGFYATHNVLKTHFSFQNEYDFLLKKKKIILRWENSHRFLCQPKIINKAVFNVFFH